MNQSIGANSFEKSLLQKSRTDGWQQESANELWKGSFSSVCSQSSVPNGTNQVYENLLRICEEIDTALPEIRSAVNKKNELQINEQQSLLEGTPLDDIFTHNVAFNDLGTSLEDIEIYEDILNASAMMDNEDCIYNQNFDIMKTNQFLQSDTFNDFLTLPLPNSMQRAQCQNTNQYGSNAATLLDRSPIFAEDEIDKYLASKNFNFSNNFPTSTSKSNSRDEDAIDPLQFWHKLNCVKLPDLCPSKETHPVVPEIDDSDESKKSTKSVLAILDFTLPSLSSSTSSCALSSPEQKDIEIEHTVTKSLQTKTPSSSKDSKKNLQAGLPVLVAESNDDSVKTNKAPKKKKKKKSKKNKINTLELLKRDLVLSSPSSSESSISSVSDIKPVKKRKLNTDQAVHQKSIRPEKSTPSKQTKSLPIKPSINIIHRNQSTPQSTQKFTSPTLKAGAIYIEQQLGSVCEQKTQPKTPKSEKNCTPASSSKLEKSTAKPENTSETPEISSKQKHKKISDSKNKHTSGTNSTPKSDKTKRKPSEDCSSSSKSSPASMPSLRSESPFSIPRVKKDSNNNELKSSQAPAPGAKSVRQRDKSSNRKNTPKK